MMKRLGKTMCLLAAALYLILCCASALAEEQTPPEGYTLDRVVTLSRHNIRSPLSGGESLLGKITPHEWFAWTSRPSELSVKGGILETEMGQYFRLLLEQEGLFPANYVPGEGEVRFYANGKQRTQATARFFAAGLLPVANVPVELHVPFDTMDDTFNPILRYVTDTYAQAALAQIAEMGGEEGMDGISAGLKDAFALLMDVSDMEESLSYQAGEYGDLVTDPSQVTLTEGSEPSVAGPIRTATSLADAMLLQYYEDPDPVKAAFGHELDREDWISLVSIVETYVETLYTAPLVSVNVAHPLLQEIRSELAAEGRKFSFLCGHDSNVASVLGALGVEPYQAPDAIETRTPVGVKLVFERWINEEGQAWYDVSLVYQTVDQLREMRQLTLDNPPARLSLSFSGIEKNADGLIAEADLLARLDSAAAAFDELYTLYPEEAEDAA